MEDTVVHSPTTPAPLQAIPLQAVPAPAPISTAAPLAIVQEDSQPARVVGNAVVEDRVLQQLRWIEKLVFVCIFLALYAIMKK
jgi:hypothetical protein